MIFLDLDDLLLIAQRVLPSVLVRDIGLLESAVARPQTTVYGEDAYAGLHNKAAALVHSVARNHGLLDGNKRVALAALVAFYGVNGFRLTMSNDEAYGFIMSIASGELDDVPAIAERLSNFAAPAR